MTTVIELESVVFERGGRRILNGIDWRIARGELWALLGANGSGKTTLLKILCGYEWPSSGSVTVLGERYGECDLREHRKRIGLVSTSLEQRISPRDTGVEVAASGFDASLGVYRALSDAEWSRAREALERVNATQIANQIFGTMSQGEQQRVLIARALVNEPALLVLDEPCAGLDPAARARFLHDVDALSRQPNAPVLVYVTHHVEEIGPWINRALALRRGRIAAAGLLSDVMQSAVLSDVFEQACEIWRENGSYRLRLEALASRESDRFPRTEGVPNQSRA